MKALTFKKGIHPHYNKDVTCKKPIEIAAPRGEFVFSMQQHIGAPSKPLVKKGDHVFVGQKIGEQNGFIGAPIHSSVSGEVVAVEERFTHQGVKATCVCVQNDEQYEEDPNIKPRSPEVYQKLTREELIEIVKEAGIVGMGGAGFPTYVKLSPPKEKKIDYIIINGAECEPYLTSDHRVMVEESERIIEGLNILLRIFPEAKACIGIEDNKPDAIEKMTQAVGQNEKIQVCTLATKYPQGSEKHLIYAITGREVPSGKLPADVGCVVQNIDTVVAIWRAVVKGRPLMRRIVTVAGHGVSKPGNYKVKIGMSFRALLEQAGVDLEKTQKIIAGGPMMGIAISNIDVPIVKGSSGILCFTEEDLPKINTQNCIRCGKCIEVCPCGLLPHTLHIDALAGNYEAFSNHSGMDCIECGSCSYTCPAKRDLVQSIRTAKNVLRMQKK